VQPEQGPIAPKPVILEPPATPPEPGGLENAPTPNSPTFSAPKGVSDDAVVQATGMPVADHRARAEAAFAGVFALAGQRQAEFVGAAARHFQEVDALIEAQKAAVTGVMGSYELLLRTHFLTAKTEVISAGEQAKSEVDAHLAVARANILAAVPVHQALVAGTQNTVTKGVGKKVSDTAGTLGATMRDGAIKIRGEGARAWIDSRTLGLERARKYRRMGGGGEEGEDKNRVRALAAEAVGRKYGKVMYSKAEKIDRKLFKRIPKLDLDLVGYVAPVVEGYGKRVDAKEAQIQTLGTAMVTLAESQAIMDKALIDAKVAATVQSLETQENQSVTDLQAYGNTLGDRIEAAGKGIKAGISKGVEDGTKAYTGLMHQIASASGSETPSAEDAEAIADTARRELETTHASALAGLSAAVKGANGKLEQLNQETVGNLDAAVQ
jgi:hypothetical protein